MVRISNLSIQEFKILLMMVKTYRMSFLDNGVNEIMLESKTVDKLIKLMSNLNADNKVENSIIEKLKESMVDIDYNNLLSRCIEKYDKVLKKAANHDSYTSYLELYKVMKKEKYLLENGPRYGLETLKIVYDNIKLYEEIVNNNFRIFENHES